MAPFRFLKAVTGLLLVCGGILLFAQHVSASRHLELADDLLGGGVAVGDQADRLESLPRNADLPCRRDVQNAAMLVRMAVLQTRLNEAGASDRLVEAYRSAQADIEHLLGCFPTDSEAWLRLAMARLMVEGPVPEVLRDAEYSQVYGPNEVWLWALRIPLLIAFGQSDEAGAERILGQDIDRLLRLASYRFIRQVYASLGEHGRDVLRKRFETDSVEILHATDRPRLEYLSDLLEINPRSEACARFFWALQECVERR